MVVLSFRLKGRVDLVFLFFVKLTRISLCIVKAVTLSFRFFTVLILRLLRSTSMTLSAGISKVVLLLLLTTWKLISMLYKMVRINSAKKTKAKKMRISEHVLPNNVRYYI